MIRSMITVALLLLASITIASYADGLALDKLPVAPAVQQPTTDWLIDAASFLHPSSVGPAGGNDTVVQRYLLSVGGTDINSAVRHLQP